MPGKGHGEKFDRKKEQAISALLTSSTVKEASKVCGVSESTLARWMSDVEFSAKYRKARSRMLEGAINLLRKMAKDAVETLHDVALDKNAHDSSRVAAARAILDIALRAEEIEDIEYRLTVLERGVVEKSKGEFKDDEL